MNLVKIGKKIEPEELVNMDFLKNEGLVRIDLAYAQPDNLLFGEQIYKTSAQLFVHEIIANVVELAALTLAKHGLRLILYDGLRTKEAQAKMLETRRVRQNPHWLEEPRLLSPPGSGAHPRAMAIDVAMETLDGALIDMGTPFDYLCEDGSGAGVNAAHREYKNLPEQVHKNRATLTNAMLYAAEKKKIPLVPLPQEWWDFRLPQAMYEEYAPICEDDLPAQMRLL